MLYRLLYIPSKFALWIYCRHLSVNKRNMFSLKGPLLLAANHPNSFLDAMILSSLFRHPVHSLARGDAFANKFFTRLLLSLKMFPVYRVSEGVENLETNYETFEKCKEVFRKNGIVLIFSEGSCINEWKLRPLKKGTARLAQSSWQEGIPLKVLPVGINYQSFTSFGKNMQLNFGNIITEKDIFYHEGYGKTINEFNDKLRSELKPLVVEIDSAEKKELENKFSIQHSMIIKILLFIPAVIGYLVHAPIYIPIQKFAYKKGAHIDHYDSLLVGMLFLIYPIYLLLIAVFLYFAFGAWYGLLTFILLPFCAWSFVQLKRQF